MQTSLDDKLDVDRVTISLFSKVGNIAGNEKNAAGCLHFYPFLTIFCEDLPGLLRTLKLQNVW